MVGEWESQREGIEKESLAAQVAIERAYDRRPSLFRMVGKPETIAKMGPVSHLSPYRHCSRNGCSKSSIFDSGQLNGIAWIIWAMF
jgi:hypothetical protein